MTKNRLEAFSDGVLAIIITIMILELKIPHGDSFESLKPLLPQFLTYILSFIYLGIYWNNHHHLLHTVLRINGKILWANLHLLFWLSLVPIVTGWMGENHYASVPTAVYGVVMLLAAIAWTILQKTIITSHGPGSKLKDAVGEDFKGKLSMSLYFIAIPSAFINQWISDAIYVVVAMMWLIPDKRIEAKLREE